LVATDGSGRMDTQALESEILADRAAGDVPVMIVATAGTTNAGMIDPIPACAAVARRHRLWLHVDAAWGGALIASERLKDCLDGLDEAHSITIDAHKWFATTMGCGMFLTSIPSVLPRIFQVSTSFMPSEQADADPYLSTVQWSRRFAGLRFFLSLAAVGWNGYGSHVEHAVDLAGSTAKRLSARGWRIANNSPTAVLCVTPPDVNANVQDVVARVVSSGRAWLSSTRFEGKQVVRICFTHGETTVEDVEELVDALCASLAA
jgi:aromatic-L-amino-acid/L-tryptophan decarboxylase